jgi:hypothetical protein
MNKRRGRKVDTFQIRAGDGAHTLLAEVDYSLDKSDGWFFAEREGAIFAAASRDELENTLTLFFRARHQVDYTPYIEVEMPTAFAERTTVVGVKFYLLMVSQQKVSSDGMSTHWLTKRGYFTDDGEPAQRHGSPTMRDSLKGLIPYTRDRYTRLEQIAQAIEDVHARLKAVLAEPAALDALEGASMLALPPTKGGKRR